VPDACWAESEFAQPQQRSPRVFAPSSFALKSRSIQRQDATTPRRASPERRTKLGFRVPLTPAPKDKSRLISLFTKAIAAAGGLERVRYGEP
jgi:hypothetical protein